MGLSLWKHHTAPADAIIAPADWRERKNASALAFFGALFADDRGLAKKKTQVYLRFFRCGGALFGADGVGCNQILPGGWSGDRGGSGGPHHARVAPGHRQIHARDDD